MVESVRGYRKAEREQSKKSSFEFEGRREQQRLEDVREGTDEYLKCFRINVGMRAVEKFLKFSAKSREHA